MMKYQKVLLLISIIFAFLTTYLGYQYLQKKDTGISNFISVPVASQDIAAATKLGPQYISIIQVSADELKNLNIITDTSKIYNTYTTGSIKKNSPFVESELTQYDTGTLLLEPGYRAIAIENSPAVGVAGAIKAGMYVDIIWVYDDGGKKQAVLAFQNVKVLATGSATVSGTANGNSMVSSDTKTVTLMLKANDAQRLTYMTSTGTIKLLLRPSPIEADESVVPTDLTNVLNH